MFAGKPEIDTILRVRAKASGVELVTYNGTEVVHLEVPADDDSHYKWVVRVLLRPAPDAETYRMIPIRLSLHATAADFVRAFDKAVVELRTGHGAAHRGETDVLLLEETRS